METRNLLHRLLDYIGAQAKTVDPRGFKLGSLKGFVRYWDAISGLPGVEFDLKMAGDHIWLRVPRLTASSPPTPNEKFKGLFKITPNPYGDIPSLDEAAFLNLLNTLTEKKDVSEHKDIEAKLRAKIAQALDEYIVLWKAWAEGEKPIRKTIAVYGDLFALKHQLEAEETSKPQEILWGIGIASWHLKFENESIDFEYPLVTQSIEISLAENTMAIELRPRATDPRVELDAFVACQVIGTAEVERTVRDHLLGPVNTNEEPQRSERRG